MFSFFGKIGNFLLVNTYTIFTIGGVLVVGTVVTMATTYRDVSNFNAGTLEDARLSTNIARYNDKVPVFFGNLSASQVAAVNFFGNLTGNVKGNVTGDVTGSLFGNANTATALFANPADCVSGSFAVAISARGNLSCSSDSSSLTNINASNITTGTLTDARTSSNIAKY